MSAPLKWKLLVGFALVFIAGLAAGAYLGAVQSRHHHFDFGHRHSLAERVRKRLQERLDLTPAQVSKTAPIIDKTSRQLEAIRAETEQRVHDTFVAADRELTPLLTADQRAKLEALEMKHDHSRKDHEPEREH